MNFDDAVLEALEFVDVETLGMAIKTYIAMKHDNHKEVFQNQRTAGAIARLLMIITELETELNKFYGD